MEVWAMRADESFEGAPGLAAVYVDVLYDPVLLSIADIKPSAFFPLFASGFDENGIVRAVGGCASLGERSLGTEETWIRVATVTARAQALGRGTLRAGPSDMIHGVALIGEFANVDPARIDFDAVNLIVESKTHAVRDRKTR
jgi:hypothetical protein